MFSLTPSRNFRALIVNILSFLLVYSPTMALPTKKSEIKKSVTKASKIALMQGNQYAHKSGELLIKFKDLADPAIVSQIGNAYGKELKELKMKGNTKKLILKDQLSLDAALLELRQINAAVEWVEPNYLLTKTANTVQALPSPNDPNFATQWALENTGQSGGTPTADISAKSGWVKTQ